MARYFILIKKKNSKRYFGAVPTKKGTTLKKIRDSARKQLSSRFNYKIITESMLKKILPKLLRKPKISSKKKPTPKKRTKRKKRRPYKK